MKPDILVPLALVASPTLLVAFALRQHAKIRLRALLIVQQALERGVPLDRGSIEAIANGYRSPYADLRRGALFLSVATAVVVMSTIVPADAAAVCQGLASFPGLAGLTYVGFHITKTRGP